MARPTKEEADAKAYDAYAGAIVNAPTPPHRAYGEIRGLPERVRKWIDRVGNDPRLPWIGLGLIDDLERVMQLLSLREFGEWLRVQPDAKLADWAPEVLDAADKADELAELHEDIDDAAGGAGHDKKTYGEAVKAAYDQAERYADMRAVLVETGALAEDDTATDPADLLRVLLA